MKLKVKPSARLDRRYLLVESDSKKDIETCILDYIGILGWARASPLFLKNESNKFILAVQRKEVVNIKAAFEASGKKIRILKISGTLSGLEK